MFRSSETRISDITLEERAGLDGRPTQIWGSDKDVSDDVPFTDVEDDFVRIAENIANTQPTPNTAAGIFGDGWKARIKILAEAASCDDGVCEEILKHLERIALVLVALHGQSTTSGVIATMMLYAKTYCPESHLHQLRDTLSVLLGMENQSEQEGSGEKGEPTWLTLLKSAKDNWELVTRSPTFNRVSALLSFGTVLGLIGHIPSLELSNGAIIKFVDLQFGKHVKAYDLVDAVFSTIIHFIERGHRAFVKRSWKLFFLENEEAAELDELYGLVMKWHDSVMIGDIQEAFGKSETDYQAVLAEAIERHKAAYYGMKPGFEKNVYWNKLAQLQQRDLAFFRHRRAGGLRVAPYCILLTGASSVGKSSVYSIITSYLLKTFQLGEPGNVVTLNEVEQFESQMRSDTTIVGFDDICNTQASFTGGKNPLERIIRYGNNVKQTANMADLEMKGKIFLQPKALVGTTNVPGLMAAKLSNEPVSVLRRFDIHVTVRVKPEYWKEGSHMLEPSKVPDAPVPDIWEFDLFYCVGQPDSRASTQRLADIPTMDPRVFKGKQMLGIDIFELLEFIGFKFDEHHSRQKKFVDRSNTLHTSIETCSKCFRLKARCECVELVSVPPESLDKQFRVEQMVTAFTTARWLHRFHIHRLFMFERINHFLALFALYRNRHMLWISLRGAFIATLIGTIGGICAMVYSDLPGPLCLFTMFVLWAALFDRTHGEILSAYEQALSMQNFGVTASQVLWNPLFKTVCSSVVIYGIYQVAKCYFAFRNMVPQGNLVPASYDDVVARDKEENPWAVPVVAPMPSTQQSRTVLREDMLRLVEANTMYMESESGSELRVFFIKSNLALVPGHMMDPVPGKKVREEFVVTMRRAMPNGTRSEFRARLSKTYSYRLQNVDARVVWVPNAPSMRDLTKFLLTDYTPRPMPGTFINRLANGTIRRTDVMTTVLRGQIQYDLDYATYVGLCGAPLVGHTKGNVILGIHVAGSTGGVRGAAAPIIQSDIDLAVSYLNKVPGFVATASMGDMPQTIYGKQCIVETEVHPKSPVNFLDKGTTVEYFGRCTGRSTAVSRVTTSAISKLVTKHMDIPNNFGPPKFKGPDGRSPWHPWRESLNTCGHPTIGVPGSALRWAVIDYLTPLIRECSRVPQWKNLKPLERLQNVNGINGCRFINAIPPSTSPGFPLAGKKSDLMVFLDPEQHPDWAAPRDFLPHIWEEAQRLKDAYRRGERGYPIFKACLKDEPTKKTKDKVRVFQAASLALQLNLREYFLPIARFLSMNPILSEIAVGINAMGPEWQQLHDHITKFGRENILAGDYSKYDLTMSSQLMFAAFSVLIEIAQVCDYSTDDIAVMKAMTADVCYAVTAFNGDLVELLGSNPSGHNLTVYINSIVGALLLRAYHYERIGAGNFRKVVAAMTYGDDLKASVHPSLHYDFNHIAYANWLSTIGMKFTMPDKTSTPTPFMKDEDCDFLKRKSVFIEELGMCVGALEIESIVKPLHCGLQSKVLTPTEQAVTNLDSAVFEFFCHGRDEYEKRRRQLINIAEDAKLSGQCRNLDKGFDYWVALWRNKYLGEDNPVVDSNGATLNILVHSDDSDAIVE